MADIITVDVQGMTCDHCERTVGAALEKAGLEVADVDWRRGQATGTPSASFSEEAAAAALAERGYTLAGVHTETGTSSVAVTDDEDTDYDLVVIGSGSAAFAAAIKARDLGASVALVEKGTIGGTCVNIGCVPSKALLRPAELYWHAGHHPFPGLHIETNGADLASLVAQKDELVEMLRKAKYEDLLDVYDIELIRGEGRFTGPDTVEVDGRTLRAGKYLIATGASPWVPPIPGLEETGYLTSTSALELTEVPGSLIVVGANAIGLELGQLFCHLGSQVTWVEALPRIAPFEEPEISGVLSGYLRDQGASVLAGAVVTAAGRDGDEVWLDVEVDGEPLRVTAEKLLMATGRRANTQGLGLEAAGVETDHRGHVVTDATLQTSNPRIYAAGDVTTNPQFVYTAALAGNIAAENALRDAGREISFETMPRVTFTSPQIASVGLTEDQAVEAGHTVMTSTLPLEAVPRALANRETTGLIKLVADEATGRLLGAHILAEGAGEVIQAAVMAIKYRATVDEIADTYHPYLTMAEGLKLAAQGFRKDIENLSCCAA